MVTTVTRSAMLAVRQVPKVTCSLLQNPRIARIATSLSASQFSTRRSTVYSRWDWQGKDVKIWTRNNNLSRREKELMTRNKILRLRTVNHTAQEKALRNHEPRKTPNAVVHKKEDVNSNSAAIMKPYILAWMLRGF